MTTTKAPHRSLVALALPKAVPALVTYAEQIMKAMTNNPNFPNPLPTLALITQAIDDLQAAAAAALSRAKGSVQARNDKRTALVKLLENLRTYVQNVADGNNETAPTVIASAGLAVRKSRARKAHTFAVLEGALSGSVKLSTASAGARACYLWQYSLDGGKTWVDVPGTLQGKTTVTGLPAGSTVLFRVRAITKSGQGDWSAPTAFIVK